MKVTRDRDDEAALAVSIFESPGRNYLTELVDFGPAFWNPAKSVPSLSNAGYTPDSPRHRIPLSTFLEFAVGATDCLSLLHHGYHGVRVVHGELRGDAFHFNRETGNVRLINFGSGLRSFENGLTSAGWSSLSRELGIKNKLRFIAPEQTGRMPAEPDSRTDIYSLGILFWTILVGSPAVDGETPIDIIQSVLGRRIPPVATKRMDVPDAISRIIQKMTQRQIGMLNHFLLQGVDVFLASCALLLAMFGILLTRNPVYIDERYHSASGLKHDLVAVQKILADGDHGAIRAFKIGTKDVSSFFMLPTALFGREREHGKIVKLIDNVARKQLSTPPSAWNAVYNFSNSSSTSDGRQDATDLGEGASSDTSSQPAKRSRSNSGVNGVSTFLAGAQNLQQDILESVEKAISNDAEEAEVSAESNGHNLSAVRGMISRRRPIHQNKRSKGCTELIIITGSAGMGKSSLIQSVQGEIRRQGYFANSKFDNVWYLFTAVKVHAHSSFRQGRRPMNHY